MSNYGISSTGFKRKRLDLLLSELNSEMRSIFGENFNLSPESPDGQINGVVSESNANLWELAEEAYNAFNPSAATGSTLSNLVQLNGIERQPASFSRATVDITGTTGTLIPAGSLISTVDGSVTFTTDEAVTISGGLAVANVTATVSGPLQASAGTITSIDTPITGWDTVTNSDDAILGSNEETDVELRSRRARSVARDAVAVIDSIRAEVLAVADVTTVFILENTSDVVDGDGLTPHSIEVIVQGGADADIAQAIFLKIPVGIATNGSTAVTVKDSQGFDHSINFQRPVAVPIYIRADITTFSEYPATGDDDIKQNIVDYANGELVSGRGFSVGDNVILSELYTPINLISGHSVDALYISTVDPAGPGGTSDITINITEVSQFEIANIIINATPSP